MVSCGKTTSYEITSSITCQFQPILSWHPAVSQSSMLSGVNDWFSPVSGGQAYKKGLLFTMLIIYVINLYDIEWKKLLKEKLLAWVFLIKPRGSGSISHNKQFNASFRLVVPPVRSMNCRGMCICIMQEGKGDRESPVTLHALWLWKIKSNPSHSCCTGAFFHFH